MDERHRNALAGFLRSEKDDRPYWETDHRGMVLPLVKSGYNNSVSYGLPGILGGSAPSVLHDILQGRQVAQGEIEQAAGDAAGAAMTGSLAMPRPSGSLGSGGRIASELPMDEASRLARAKQLGFDTDTTWYHGTNAAFDEFKPSGAVHAAEGASELKPAGAPHLMGEGVYLTKDQGYAGDYGSNVMPLVVRGNIATPKDVPSSAKGGLLRRVLMGADHQKSADWARQNGYAGYYMPEGFGELSVFDPKNIRSVNAAFDPAKSDSANLLAANAPTSAAAPLLEYLAQGDRTAEPQRATSEAAYDDFMNALAAINSIGPSYQPGPVQSDWVQDRRNEDPEGVYDGNRLKMGRPMPSSDRIPPELRFLLPR